MHVLVAHVLALQPDPFAAALAVVGEVGLVAGQAAGLLVRQHVALAGEDGVAVPAAEVGAVPVLAQGVRELAGEDDLVARAATRPEVLCVMTLAEDASVEDAVR